MNKNSKITVTEETNKLDNYQDLRLCYSTLYIVRDCEKVGFEVRHSFIHKENVIDYSVCVFRKFRVIEGFSDIWSDYVSEKLLNTIQWDNPCEKGMLISEESYLLNKAISHEVELESFYRQNNELAKVIIQGTKNLITEDHIKEAFFYRLNEESRPFLDYLKNPSKGFDLIFSGINQYGMTENAFITIERFVKEQKILQLNHSLNNNLESNKALTKKMKV